MQTIDEESEEDEDTLITASFYAELMGDEPLTEDADYEEICGYPVQMMPEDIVLFMVKDDESEFRGNKNLSDDQSVYRATLRVTVREIWWMMVMMKMG